MKKLFVLSVSMLAVVFFNINNATEVEATGNPSTEINMVTDDYNPLSRATFWGNGGTLQLNRIGRSAIHWNINLNNASVWSFRGTMTIKPARGGRATSFPVSGKTGQIGLKNIPQFGAYINLSGQAMGSDGKIYQTAPNSLFII